MLNKKNVAVIFGGRSSEHDISCISATTIIENIDTELYNLHLIGITKEGAWLKVNSTEEIKNKTWTESKVTAIISPDVSHNGILYIENNQMTLQTIDVIFPVLHGLYGEDGTIQGLFEMSNIPYVGCGVIASGLSMDKFFTKVIVERLGIRQAQFVPVFKRHLNDMDKVVAKVEASLSYPVFVKPSNAGSSVGVSKAYNREELIDALNLAAIHDKKILVEETIIGRELECAVLGSSDIKASGVGEVVAAADFYDFDAKYNNNESKTDLSPVLPEGAEDKIRENAIKIFRAVDGFGLARIDFFLTKDTNEVVFNELNTLPGFTSISMYPMLWAKQGIEKKELLSTLIEMAYERNA